jgi:hypothetical protein
MLTHSIVYPGRRFKEFAKQVRVAMQIRRVRQLLYDSVTLKAILPKPGKYLILVPRSVSVSL